MDGLRSVFNERSRYICLWYISLLHFLGVGRLTTAEFVQKDHLIDELLNRSFEFHYDHFLDIGLGEATLHLTIESDPSLGSLNCGPSGISQGPPSPWILGSKEPLSDHVDSRLEKSFQILATAWLIEHSMTEDKFYGQNSPGLRYAQSVAGSKLLKCLEKTLSSSSLSKLGADTLGALLRILLFTVFVVTWPRPRIHLSPVSHLYIRALS